MSDKKAKNPLQSEEGACTTQSSTSSESEPAKDEFSVEYIRQFLNDKLGINNDKGDGSKNTQKLVQDLTLDGLIEHWKKNGIKKVITMVGAGISTSAGIPDFRSPGSGLYDNLSKYNLPHPTAIFELDYFEENPTPFFVLAKELYPGSFKPTPCHYFVRMLHEKGLLVRHYTQNIDTLERISGIPGDKLVEAHGTFYTNHCLGCRKLYSMEWMKEKIFEDVVPTCDKCNAVVKPDIVFFGENLPDSFYELPDKDFKECDLLIIMGTSLEVQPFASLVDRVGSKCLRLLINREKVGIKSSGLSAWYMFGPGLSYDRADNKRDIAYIGDCDDGVTALAEGLGWGEDLKKLIEEEHQQLDNQEVVEEGKAEKTAADTSVDSNDTDKQDEVDETSQKSV